MLRRGRPLPSITQRKHPRTSVQRRSRVVAFTRRFGASAVHRGLRGSYGWKLAVAATPVLVLFDELEAKSDVLLYDRAHVHRFHRLA